MKMILRRADRSPDTSDDADGGGTARVGARTKDLTKRLRPGDVAVIDHADIDRVAAEALVAAGPCAVLNAAPSTTGRYPNAGPDILLQAGIILVDDLGPEIMTVHDGARVTVEGGAVLVDGQRFATGTRQTPETVERDLAAAREGLSDEIERFAENTLSYLRRERDLLLDGVGVPDVRTEIDGRHVLIVVRGYHYREDLAMLRSYIAENRPVLVGVDGGADAILDAGYRPDMIVGDMDSVSDRALSCGAEIVVHAYRDGNAPGLERVRALGVDPVVFPATGTSEDIAMLLADDKGAKLIVAVGTHATLVEFLDKGRAGMASTFLTRLRVGGKLVDAKGVSRLYRTRISNLQLTLLSLAGVAAVLAALWSTAAGQTAFGLVGAQIDDLVSWIGSLFGG
ncbi:MULTISPECIES: putative cytokinetic ring protein SteA [unclassified Isoptericola]|uniref:putative cytokinetic ring protein SteA n=1 Tax=unclassified Isoptericola TaxID=2623355 RepID=UPI00271237CE|nr:MULTISPECIES: putative cytokinetic ring protein SteA [unclassified Isoptericola]MDO8144730.1 putative cytokinetic ring protein SteA [Isoptericola sp. 178]MDO8149508.1 putative cytokinetic ring protein SteA [Isoptericola sp. b515]MDO8152442.1 putative cytokinetic ring protein SteA [Isoptericola sp. b408]